MRRLRLFLALIVAGAAAVGGLGAAASAAKPVACPSMIGSPGNGWIATKPHFTVGPQQVTIARSAAYAPGLVYATNGSQIMQTYDLGCTWHAFSDIPTSPGQAILPVSVPQPLDGLLRLPSTFTITALAVPSSPIQSSYVYIGGNNTSALGPQPLIYVVKDGKTLEASNGLPPNTGTIDDLTANPQEPTFAYTVVGKGNGINSGPGLYVTGNAGGKWSQRKAPTDGLSDFRADPVVPTTVFALRPGQGLDWTTNGGDTEFVSAGKPGHDVTSYDLVSGGSGARIVQGHSSRRQVDLSFDDARSWISAATPVLAKQVTIQPLTDTIAVSDGKRLFQETGVDGTKIGNEDITPTDGVPGQLAYSAPSGAGYLLTGVLKQAVVIRGFTVVGHVLTSLSQLRKVVLAAHTAAHQFPPTLLSTSKAARLPPGRHTDVHYTLLLPRTPSPVDVMFLVDTTSSMQSTIDGLRQDLGTIVNDVADTGLDARFGVAEFRDYDPNVGDMGAGEIGDKPYTLRRVIGPDDRSLQGALNKLKASGGGDPPEASLTALLQSTTGVGQIVGHKVVIPTGQEAAYRPGSLRLAVIATDAPFHRERNYLTPQWNTVVSSLLANRVYPIGLAVQDQNEDPNARPQFEGYHDEQDIAGATHSIAPRGGVDCNGDLVPDIAEGQPFVCKVPASQQSNSTGGLLTPAKVQSVKLAPAVISAAENLPDMRPVGLAISGGNGIAKLISPTTAPVVNLRNDNTLQYTVRYTCPKLTKAHSFHLSITANDGQRQLASQPMSVTCDPLAVLPHTKPRIPPAAIAVVPPAAVAAAPPAPGNPLPNANPNPNPVPNANVGFAGQEEEQRQLAYADADAGGGLDESTEMQMSSLGGDGTDPAPWLAGAAGALLTAATAYAARTRLSAAWHTNNR